MPFLRFSRDKRGYEHTYLLHAGSKKGAPARILYWYRTPPGVRVGRLAFDDEVRQALESQYPSVQFDWARLTETPPPPPPDVEHWRERRRLEKAARQARQAAEREGESEEFEPGAEVGGGDSGSEEEPQEPRRAGRDGRGPRDKRDNRDGRDSRAAGRPGRPEEGVAAAETSSVEATTEVPNETVDEADTSDGLQAVNLVPVTSEVSVPGPEGGVATGTDGVPDSDTPDGTARARRRRRRGGRRRRRPAAGAGPGSAEGLVAGSVGEANGTALETQEEGGDVADVVEHGDREGPGDHGDHGNHEDDGPETV